MQWDPVKFNEEQKKYIWNWQWEGIELVIGDGAYIHYKKEKDNMSTSISGPITEINDNEFKVGIWFINTAFVIDKKPYQDWNLWKMIVDWNELSRITNRYELKIPEVWELNKLTNDFVTVFYNSLINDNFELLYNNISKLWQTATSVDELTKMLSRDIKSWFTIEEIIDNDIVYSKPPYLNESNFLVLEWYYTTTPVFSFRLEFAYEYPNWKIVNLKFY